MAKRVLIVDDDPDFTSAMRRLLERLGYVIYEENDPTKALEAARAFQPQFVILDFLMPKMHGGDVAWQLASDSLIETPRMILCTGVSKSELACKLPPVRIEILEKPVDARVVLELLEGS